jgi:nucleoside-diphosphate-sugar epimerase
MVTGGTGFIGSHLVRLLLERGTERVVIVDRQGAAGSFAALANRVVVEQADIGVFSDVVRVVDKYRPEAIFHIAAMLAPACDDHPESGIRSNGLATYHVLEAARLFGARQVIFASSLSVFAGVPSNVTVVDDHATTRPNTIYAAAKLFSENLGLCYRRLHGIDFRGLRLPNVNGPGAMTHGYLEYFNRAIEASVAGRPYAIYVEPHVRIPILHISDAARAFYELAAAPRDSIRTVNYTVLGPTPAPTAGELIEAIKQRVPGAKLEFAVKPEISHLVEAIGGLRFDDRYARTEWGWKHEFDLTRIIESFQTTRGKG